MATTDKPKIIFTDYRDTEPDDYSLTAAVVGLMEQGYGNVSVTVTYQEVGAPYRIEFFGTDLSWAFYPGLGEVFGRE